MFLTVLPRHFNSVPGSLLPSDVMKITLGSVWTLKHVCTCIQSHTSGGQRTTEAVDLHLLPCLRQDGKSSCCLMLWTQTSLKAAKYPAGFAFHLADYRHMHLQFYMGSETLNPSPSTYTSNVIAMTKVSYPTRKRSLSQCS